MLSELTREYIDDFAAIAAGRCALEADIPRVLEAVQNELRKTCGDLAPELWEHELTTTVVDDNGGEEFMWYDLKLTWRAEDASPLVVFEPNYRELHEELFDELFAGVHIPKISPDQLRDNPVQACVDAWRDACRQIDAVTDEDDSPFQTRLAGVQMLRHVSGNLIPELKGLSRTVPRTAWGETTGDDVSACYIRWDQEVEGQDDSVWYLALYPASENGGRLWLGLVAREAGDILDPVRTVPATIGYHDHPVVADFSQQLADVVAEKRPRNEVAAEITDACLKLYRDTLAGLAARAQKACK